MSRYTKAQITALTYAFTKNGAMFAPVNRTGGAYRRCVERLAAEHLLNDEPPFRLTVKGLKALYEIRSAKWAKHGCMAYLNDLQAVERALESININPRSL